jgi:hypothetical protein
MFRIVARGFGLTLDYLLARAVAFVALVALWLLAGLLLSG